MKLEQQSIDGVLRATRQVGVRDVIVLPGSGYNIEPEDLSPRLHSHWGVLKGKGEKFLLMERRFKGMIDDILGNVPSRLIEHFLERNKNAGVDVLDVGGGRDGTTAKDIAGTSPLVRVTNLDMVAVDESVGNLTSKQGDVTDMDLPNESFDVAYSHQVVPFLSKKDNSIRKIKVIDEVARVLKPGGVASIDFTDDPSLPDGLLGEITQRVGGLVVPKRKNYDGRLFGVFMIIAKAPVDTVILDISKSVPDLVV